MNCPSEVCVPIFGFQSRRQYKPCGLFLVQMWFCNDKLLNASAYSDVYGKSVRSCRNNTLATKKKETPVHVCKVLWHARLTCCERFKLVFTNILVLNIGLCSKGYWSLNATLTENRTTVGPSYKNKEAQKILVEGVCWFRTCTVRPLESAVILLIRREVFVITL